MKNPLPLAKVKKKVEKQRHLPAQTQEEAQERRQIGDQKGRCIEGEFPGRRLFGKGITIGEDRRDKVVDQIALIINYRFLKLLTFCLLNYLIICLKFFIILATIFIDF